MKGMRQNMSGTKTRPLLYSTFSSDRLAFSEEIQIIFGTVWFVRRQRIEQSNPFTLFATERSYIFLFVIYFFIGAHLFINEFL